jgi:hypothetical protein
VNDAAFRVQHNDGEVAFGACPTLQQDFCNPLCLATSNGREVRGKFRLAALIVERLFRLARRIAGLHMEGVDRDSHKPAGLQKVQGNHSPN